MLTHLYAKKVDKHAAELQEAGRGKPLSWHYLNTLESFTPLKASGDRYHFILERPNSGHTVGVYVNAVADNNEVHIYLHETEGATESSAKLLRDTVSRKMEQLYPDRKIILFYPKPMLQRDFSSCGVFAFKAMSFFRKNPDEMDEWLRSVRPAAIINGNTGKAAIPMEKLKPKLLKIYHYALQSLRPEDPKLLKEQLDAPVNKNGETLEKYLSKFERQVPRLGREGERSANLTFKSPSFA